MTNVTLVDKNGIELGTMEKLEAHKRGLLHLAISIYIYNTKGQILLQRRASNKYHCGGLWSNACCSHPFPAEKEEVAAIRRLKEELGMEIESLYEVTRLTYNLPVTNNLIEHEHAVIFFGISDNNPVLDFSEADKYQFLYPNEILALINENDRIFTPWFNHTFKKLLPLLSAKYKNVLPKL